MPDDAGCCRLLLPNRRAFLMSIFNIQHESLDEHSRTKQPCRCGWLSPTTIGAVPAVTALEKPSTAGTRSDRASSDTFPLSLSCHSPSINVKSAGILSRSNLASRETAGAEGIPMLRSPEPISNHLGPIRRYGSVVSCIHLKPHATSDRYYRDRDTCTAFLNFATAEEL